MSDADFITRQEASDLAARITQVLIHLSRASVALSFQDTVRAAAANNDAIAALQALVDAMQPLDDEGSPT